MSPLPLPAIRQYASDEAFNYPQVSLERMKIWETWQSSSQRSTPLGERTLKIGKETRARRTSLFSEKRLHGGQMLYAAIRILKGFLPIIIALRSDHFAGSLQVVSLHRPMLQRRTFHVLDFWLSCSGCI